MLNKKLLMAGLSGTKENGIKIVISNSEDFTSEYINVYYVTSFNGSDRLTGLGQLLPEKPSLLLPAKQMSEITPSSGRVTIRLFTPQWGIRFAGVSQNMSIDNQVIPTAVQTRRGYPFDFKIQMYSYNTWDEHPDLLMELYLRVS